MRLLKLYLIFLLVFGVCTALKRVSIKNDVKKYTISLKHPGEKEAITVVLFQVLNKNGLPIEYYMDVPSVICLEKVCKIIPVQLFWNDLGKYQKYELQQGATLEKYKADLFESEDYTKLHKILSDKNSPFKDVYYNEILTVPNNADADAVSGATALQLDLEDTVPGAALGCYTLWHWANGEIVYIIKKLTGNTLTNKQKLQFVNQNNEVYYDVIIASFKNDKIDAELIYQIFKKGNTSHRLQVFNLLHRSKNTSAKFIESISKIVVINKNYQEISSFITFLESNQINSVSIINDVFSLLKADFIIARRAYWFLKDKELTTYQKNILYQFYNRNKKRM